jgi:hypothetical protein
MVSHRLFSISALFGGKNSNEIAGWLCARVAVDVAGLVSLMTLVISATNLEPARRWRYRGQDR